MGMPAIAITDDGTMFGVIEFFNAAKQVGIKPVIGLEAYLAARTIKEHDPQDDKKSTHLLLLAETRKAIRTCSSLPALPNWRASTISRALTMISWHSMLKG